MENLQKMTDKNSLIPPRPPLEKPPFTLKDITDAVPPHCFKRSLLKSSGHLCLNLLICLLLLYLATFIDELLFPFILWPVYWYLQGVYMGGLWVLAHECGHHAFSAYPIIDDTIGFILHSSLLVPYQSWQLTHHHHHLNSGNCDHDQVFVPPSRSEVQSAIVELLEESPLYNFLSLILMLLLGWMPAYLVTNFGGPSKYERNANHFNPSSVLYTSKYWNQVLMADIGVFTTLTTFSIITLTHGFRPILFYYGIPYIIVSCHLIVVTYLNHTDVYIPRFRDPEWTWMRGALSTVDRSFGHWLDYALHNISNTHVCHHLFPKMPFYNTVEATRAIGKILGQYYLRDETPILKALWRSYRNCKFVEDDDPIVFYKRNLNTKRFDRVEQGSDCQVSLYLELKEEDCERLTQ